MMNKGQQINLPEPQRNRTGTGNFVNLIVASTVYKKTLAHTFLYRFSAPWRPFRCNSQEWTAAVSTVVSLIKQNNTDTVVCSSSEMQFFHLSLYIQRVRYP